MNIVMNILKKFLNIKYQMPEHSAHHCTVKAWGEHWVGIGSQEFSSEKLSPFFMQHSLLTMLACRSGWVTSTPVNNTIYSVYCLHFMFKDIPHSSPSYFSHLSLSYYFVMQGTLSASFFACLLSLSFSSLTCLPSSMTATTVPVPVNPCIHARRALMSKPLVAWYWPVLYCIEQQSGVYISSDEDYITRWLAHPWPLGVPQRIWRKGEGPLVPFLQSLLFCKTHLRIKETSNTQALCSHKYIIRFLTPSSASRSSAREGSHSLGLSVPSKS